MMEDAKLIGLDLSVASPEALEILIEDTADHEVFREILASNAHRPEVLRLLMDSPNVPTEIKEAVWKHLSLPSPLPSKPKHVDEGRKHGLLQKIQQLSVGERIALALRGGQEIRSILLKDSAITYALGVAEIMARTHFVATRTYQHLPLYIAAGAIYLVLTYLGTRGLHLLEERTRIPGYHQNL